MGAVEGSGWAPARVQQHEDVQAAPKWTIVPFSGGRCDSDATVGASNVDIVQQAFAAFERRDPELLVAIARRDIVFEPVTAQIAAGGQPYRGHAGLRRYIEDVSRVWQELRPSPDTFYEREGGIVVATGRVYAWGAGRVIDAPAGWLWRVQDGRLAYGRVFETAAGALAAAGIVDAHTSA
jgi:ketosteroid isomerase-like protein